MMTQNVFHLPKMKRLEPMKRDRIMCRLRRNELYENKKEKDDFLIKYFHISNEWNRLRLTRHKVSCVHRRRQSKAFVNRVKSINFVRTSHDLLKFGQLFQRQRQIYWWSHQWHHWQCIFHPDSNNHNKSIIIWRLLQNSKQTKINFNSHRQCST